MKIRETHSWRPVWRVCAEGDTLEGLFDDGHRMPRSGMKARVRAIISLPTTHTFCMFWQRHFAGCFVLYDLGRGRYEVHTLLLEKFRGIVGVRLGRYATDFVLGLSYVRELVSFCPDCIPQAYLFAKMCGWKKLCEVPGAWIKHGTAHAVKIVGITKEDFCHSYS